MQSKTKKITKNIKRIKRVQLKDTAPITLQQIRPSSSNVQVQPGRIKMSWPKVSQVIYPKQSIRVNTGWSTQQLATDSSMTTMPHRTMVQNNLASNPQFYDQSAVGQQIVQTVSNQNQFPVKVQYGVNEDGSDTFTLLRLHPQTLLAQQVLCFDFGSLISGICGVAQHVVPILSML